MKLKVKLTAAVLAVLMMFAATGCNMEDTSWVYELNGERLPAGIYLNYMLDAYSELSDKYMEATYEEGEMWIQPTPAQVRSHEVDGQPGDAWIVNRAREMVLQRYGLLAKCDEMGLALSPEDLVAINANVGNIWAVGAKFYEANGISNSSLSKYLEEQRKRELLFFELYGEGGEFEVPRSTLLSELDSRFVKVEYMRIDAQYFEGDTIEAQAENAKTAAVEYVRRLNEGEAIEDIEFEYRQIVAPEMDNIPKPEPGEMAATVKREELEFYGNLGEAFAAATTSAYTLHSYDNQFYIVKGLSITTDPADLERHRDSILGDMKYEEYLQKLLERGEAMSPTANQAAISRYTVNKLKLDFEKYAM